MQTHFLPRSLSKTLSPDKETRVLFSIADPLRAVIFIHGYSGNTLSSWHNFQGLLPGRAGFQRSDIFFYGYDGIRSDLYSSAATFRIFLERLFLETQFVTSIAPPSIFPRKGYVEIIIVAHSLGAVIARRALLDAIDEGKCWPNRTSLVLYAPAHKGANIVNLISDTISGWPLGTAIGNLLRFGSPLIEQLKPGSKDLQKLLCDTEEKIDAGYNTCLTAKRVFIAQFENIVENERFCKDPPPKSIPGTTHISICKPRSSFLVPLYELEECI